MCTVIFVGGDERQRRTIAKLNLPPDVEVNAFQPCWSRNWNKTLHTVEREIEAADALVISTDVPTELGRELRALARDKGKPWIGGRARGAGAILSLITTAADRARRRQRPIRDRAAMPAPMRRGARHRQKQDSGPGRSSSHPN